MVTTHNLGYPRIGSRRELKFALEAYWRGEKDLDMLTHTGEVLRAQNWQKQAALDLVPVGDFSFYDHVLDTSVMVSNLPARAQQTASSPWQAYFLAARGRDAASDNEQHCRHNVAAAEMTKWFDTNYHYLVPEFSEATRFEANGERLLSQLAEACAQGHNAKPVILGPVSYLWLGKSKDNTDKLALLDDLVACYAQILDQLADADVEWVQIDEPVLVTELDAQWTHALNQAYFSLSKSPVKILLTTYFGPLRDNLQLACELPVSGLHLDAVNAADEINKVVDWLPSTKVLSLGIINGRNIWRSHLTEILDRIEPIHQRLQDRLWIAPSCSLLHVPIDLQLEQKLDPEIKSWLAFADQKLDELSIIAKALNHGRDSVAEALTDNARAISSRQQSSRVNNLAVKQRCEQLNPSLAERQSPYAARAEIQQQKLKLPAFPTTTIGSFPQTADIRRTRKLYRDGAIGFAEYQQDMQREIHLAIKIQEQLDLDVLVHGEAERNDMVEYFGSQLDGYAFSELGWVQSYGSRCVKPPIIFGDIQRPQTMTVDWIRYAQSLTQRPVKGMLTGPVTMLNWSFVRDDQPRSETCLQLALAIRDEVLDLEQAGTQIIQIDEAALREGLPLRRSDWQSYLDWAVFSFKLCANGVSDETQIHTHMCYSEFNDIIEAIAAMDADVITIETSRSDMELLDVFRDFEYPNAIGPGVYDIHSPNIPEVSQIIDLMTLAAQRIPNERLWINPDCGLKTRRWEEVRPALTAMVQAAKACRQQLVKAA